MKQRKVNKMDENKSTFKQKIKKLWENDKIRFLFVSGFNTFVGLLLSLLFSFLLTSVLKTNENVKIWFFSLNLPLTFSFILGFPLSYTTQALIAFRQKWQWKKLAIFPLTSIPNYGLQQLFYFIWKHIFSLTNLSADLVDKILYILAPLCALPIMYFIIRFFVRTNKNNKSEPNE